MRVIHHTLANGSGLNRVSTNMVNSERKLGIDSYLCYTDKPIVEGDGLALPLDKSKEADVHVVHAHLPDGCKGKTIFIPHGTPEHCFAMAIEQHHKVGFWAGDPFMLSLYRLNSCDATVTFWERHRAIWQSLSPKADVQLIKMGVDVDFWKPITIPQNARWLGKPSVLTCENSHQIKWPLDIFIAWPSIMNKTEAVLHAHYIPTNQHRFWYPLITANGTTYRAFTSDSYMDSNSLRNAFNSCDYYLNLVRYGDFNSVGLEAKASGCKVISYRGNPYADYWITEGSQLTMAEELIDIFDGKVTPRKTDEIVSLESMAKEMLKIYEGIL